MERDPVKTSHAQGRGESGKEDTSSGSSSVVVEHSDVSPKPGEGEKVLR